jgi:hypothetical protein
MTELILPTHTFKDDPDEQLIVEHSQVISDDLLAQNQELRDASAARAGEYHKLAAIPTVIVEKWMREGFNIFEDGVQAKEIIARLKRENLDAFITTTKRV